MPHGRSWSTYLAGFRLNEISSPAEPLPGSHAEVGQSSTPNPAHHGARHMSRFLGPQLAFAGFMMENIEPMHR